MTVIGGPVAVNGYADADVIFGEKLTELFVQQNAISVHSQIEVTYITQCGLKCRYDPPEPSHSREQRFTAMEHHFDAAEPMPGGVLGDAMCRL